MAIAGARFGNMREPLVWFRAGEDVYARRASQEMHRSEWNLQHRLREYGLFGSGRMWLNLGLRTAFKVMPRAAMKTAYRTVLGTKRPVAATRLPG